jgi:hypothetical protein
VAIATGLRGEITSVSGGAASGLMALASAANAVARGRANSVLCGGIEVASLGARRVFARNGRDAIVLFLLEAAAPGDATRLNLADWKTGFGAAPFANEPPGDFLANDPLLRLAASAGRSGEGLLASAAPEGFWAFVSYRRGA